MLQQTNYPELLKLVKLNVDSYLGSTQKTTQKDGTVNGTVNDTVNDTINDTINVPINAKVLFEVMTVKRDLYVLRDMKLIKYVGSNNTGHWEVDN